MVENFFTFLVKNDSLRQSIPAREIFMREALNTAANKPNPIDVVETILNHQSYTLERRSLNEVVVEVQGKWNNMLVFFSWQESMQCLHISCLMDVEGKRDENHKIFELLALINEDIWVGHFSYWAEKQMPVFRHSIFCNQQNPHFCNQIAQVFEIAIRECERMYPIFNVVLTKGMNPSQALMPLSMLTVGEA